VILSTDARSSYKKAAVGVVRSLCRELDLRSIHDKFFCVYFLLFRDEIVYVGQSGCIDARIAQHISVGDKLFDRVLWMSVDENDVDAYEGALIRALRPKHNAVRKSGQMRSPANRGRDEEILNALGLRHEVKLGNGRIAVHDVECDADDIGDGDDVENENVLDLFSAVQK
jgi:hypothetical protein